MSTATWIGAKAGLVDQGFYDEANNWSGGAVPQPGDTVDINGIAGTGIYKIGQIITFPIGGGYTSIDLFPYSSPGTLLGHPSKLPGEVIADQTLNINDQAGASELWLQKTSLVADTINVVGTAVFETFLGNSISGLLSIGSASATGLLQMVVSGGDTSGAGIAGKVADTVFSGMVSVGAGSTFDIEALTGNGLLSANVQNSGTWDVNAGSRLIVDDLDGFSANNASDHATTFLNDGLVQVTGQAGASTRAEFNTNVAGRGTISVAGNGAAPSATVVTFEGNVTGENITVSDAIVHVVDNYFAVQDGTIAGFAVTGGSFTFGTSGTLLLDQATLTSPQFTQNGIMVEVPNGQHPFTTPIYGFGAGDTIGLQGQFFAGLPYDTVWDATRHLLRVEQPSGPGNGPPTIIAALHFEGDYEDTGFHLAGNAHTGELDLTYQPPAQGASMLNTVTPAEAGRDLMHSLSLGTWADEQPALPGAALLPVIGAAPAAAGWLAAQHLLG